MQIMILFRDPAQFFYFNDWARFDFIVLLMKDIWKLPTNTLPTTSSVPACYNTSPSAVCSSCNKSQSQLSLWHNRPWHPHSVILYQVVQQMNIHLGSTAAIPFSSSCQYGKLHQQTFLSFLGRQLTHFRLYTLMFGAISICVNCWL